MRGCGAADGVALAAGCQGAIRGLLQERTAVALGVTQRANRRPDELAAHLQVRRSHVNELLSSLQDRGLVRCDRDPTDRRARVVRLTRNGRAYLHELGEASLRRFAADLDDLTEEEMAALKKGLRAAIASVQCRLISSDA